MIENFLIIKYIGEDDKLGLRINKEFFIHHFKKQKINNELLVLEIMKFLESHNVKLDKNFSIIVNQGPGGFSGLRVSLAIAKGLKISSDEPVSDLEQVTNSRQRNAKKARSGDKEAKLVDEILAKLEPILEEGKPARLADLTEEELFAIKSLIM